MGRRRLPQRICRERSRPFPTRLFLAASLSFEIEMVLIPNNVGTVPPNSPNTGLPRPPRSNCRVDEAERIHHVGGTAALVPPYENYNNLNTVLSFAGEAECAVFRPDRGSDPTMSPAGGG